MNSSLGIYLCGGKSIEWRRSRRSAGNEKSIYWIINEIDWRPSQARITQRYIHRIKVPRGKSFQVFHSRYCVGYGGLWVIELESEKVSTTSHSFHSSSFFHTHLCTTLIQKSFYRRCYSAIKYIKPILGFISNACICVWINVWHKSIMFLKRKQQIIPFIHCIYLFS